MIKALLVAFTAALCVAVHAQPAYFPLEKPAEGGYYASMPETPGQGLVLFIPGPGQDPLGVFPDSAVVALAHARGWGMIAVAHPGKLLLTPHAHRYLHEVIRQASTRFGVPQDRIATGGLGQGGVLALQFAQECGAAPSFYPMRPRAVFCIDTPVDLAEWWRSCERDIQRNASPEAMAEAGMALSRLTAELGGAPDTLRQRYLRHSPFSMDAEPPGKERFLLDARLMLYYSGDLSFQMKERGRTLYDLPAGPASAMVKSLFDQGHPGVSFEWLQGAGKDSFDRPEWVYWLSESLGGPPGRE